LAAAANASGSHVIAVTNKVPCPEPTLIAARAAMRAERLGELIGGKSIQTFMHAKKQSLLRAHRFKDSLGQNAQAPATVRECGRDIANLFGSISDTSMHGF